MVYGRCVFPFNAAPETESNLYQLSCLSLPIHTSANATQAGGRVDLDGYAIFRVWTQRNARYGCEGQFENGKMMSKLQADQ
jgi:hypothetical protein